jgi:hypothetical protein
MYLAEFSKRGVKLTNIYLVLLQKLFAGSCLFRSKKSFSVRQLGGEGDKWLEGKEKLLSCIFLAGVQFVLQLCHAFCSCAFFSDLLKLRIIPMYNFADVQMKYLMCYLFCSCAFSLSVVNYFCSCMVIIWKNCPITVIFQKNVYGQHAFSTYP